MVTACRKHLVGADAIRWPISVTLELILAGGKLTATFASICGIIVLAFPISMIVEKFAVAQEEVAKAVAAK